MSSADAEVPTTTAGGEVEDESSQDKEKKPSLSKVIQDIATTGTPAKRKRSEVTRYEPEGHAKEQWKVAKGPGVPLKETKVAKLIEKAKPDDEIVKTLFSLLYHRPGKKTTRKRDVLAFSGWTAENKNDNIEQNIRRFAETKKDILLKLCTALGVSKTGSKEDIAKGLVEALKKPTPSKKSRTKSSPSKKKKAASKTKDEEESEDKGESESDGEMSEEDDDDEDKEEDKDKADKEEKEKDDKEKEKSEKPGKKTAKRTASTRGKRKQKQEKGNAKEEEKSEENSEGDEDDVFEDSEEDKSDKEKEKSEEKETPKKTAAARGKRRLKKASSKEEKEAEESSEEEPPAKRRKTAKRSASKKSKSKKADSEEQRDEEQQDGDNKDEEQQEGDKKDEEKKPESETKDGTKEEDAMQVESTTATTETSTVPSELKERIVSELQEMLKGEGADIGIDELISKLSAKVGVDVSAYQNLIVEEAAKLL